VDFVVILKCPDNRPPRGKYLVGRHSVDQRIIALVFDSEISFHPAIAKKYRLISIGGGYFVVDHAGAAIHISGKSETYGAEPNRQLTCAALTAALPMYRTAID
jgi:hypothetical protein